MFLHMSRTPLLRMVLGSMLWALSACGGSSDRPTAPVVIDSLDEVPFIPADARLLALAERITPDDWIRILATFDSPQGRQQWLVLLRSDGPDVTESITPLPDRVIYDSFGQSFAFTRTQERATLQILGPVGPGAGEPAVAQPVVVLVESALLDLGFADACAAMLSLTAAGPKVNYRISSEPIPKDELVPENLRPSLSIQTARALAGTTPTLLSVFDLIFATPQLETILRSVLPTPGIGTIFDALWNGVYLKMSFKPQRVAVMDPKAWALPEKSRLYLFPMELEMGSGLQLNFAVTDPVARMRTFAGIVGVLAKPNDDSGRRLTLRVLNP